MASFFKGLASTGAGVAGTAVGGPLVGALASGATSAAGNLIGGQKLLPDILSGAAQSGLDAYLSAPTKTTNPNMLSDYDIPFIGAAPITSVPQYSTIQPNLYDTLTFKPVKPY